MQWWKKQESPALAVGECQLLLLAKITVARLYMKEQKHSKTYILLDSLDSKKM